MQGFIRLQNSEQSYGYDRGGRKVTVAKALLSRQQIDILIPLNGSYDKFKRFL